MAFLNNQMSDHLSPQTAHLYKYTLFVLDKNVHFNKRTETIERRTLTAKSAIEKVL